MLIPALSVVAKVIAMFVSSLFLLSVVIKRNDIADIAWGVGIALVAIVSYLTTQSSSPLPLILTILVTLWGVRLSLRILVRNIKKPEDFRYKQWRDEWGKWFYVRSFFQIYLLQGFLMVVVGYCTIHASMYSSFTALSFWTAIGVAVWCVGYFFEVVGDWQLDTYINSKPAPGQVLKTGLWRYTRHPNYFGEVTMWWGIWLIVAPLTQSYLALVSPLTITFLILRVSGIPMLEKRFAGNPNFEAYKATTSAFFPLPPKRP
jgi:steroid 5-alpha reductase family enzyme